MGTVARTRADRGRGEGSLMGELFGIVVFALGILIAVCVHEAGHMGTAKAFGMKVTRYFVGFGPTLWSFRRGETEYGVKALPLGGFVKIVGMTPQGDVITAVGGQATPTYADMRSTVRAIRDQDTTITYTRDKQSHTATVHIYGVQRVKESAFDKLDKNIPLTADDLEIAGMLGVNGAPPMVKVGPVEGVGLTLKSMGQMVALTFESLGQIPAKIPNLISSITGGQRDPNTPVSVV